jgi:hypothetical protein
MTIDRCFKIFFIEDLELNFFDLILLNVKRRESILLFKNGGVVRNKQLRCSMMDHEHNNGYEFNRPQVVLLPPKPFQRANCKYCSCTQKCAFSGPEIYL